MKRDRTIDPDEVLWCAVFQMVDGDRMCSEYRTEDETREAFEGIIRTWGKTPLLRMKDFRGSDIALVTEHIEAIEVVKTSRKGFTEVGYGIG